MAVRVRKKFKLCVTKMIFFFNVWINHVISCNSSVNSSLLSFFFLCMQAFSYGLSVQFSSFTLISTRNKNLSCS